jgi:uroporphyrinogen decarboxylase
MPGDPAAGARFERDDLLIQEEGMVSRRQFFLYAATAANVRGAAITHKDRIDRALKGQEPDHLPFTFWYHFHDETKPASEHAKNTLEFHRKFRTDLVKVMSDYPYPKPKGAWYELKVEQNPFAEQVRALELIRDGLDGRAYFIETMFNPWQVAEKISSKEDVLKLKAEKPQKLLDALDVIAKSQANHSKRAVAAGAGGIFLSITNAQDDIMTRADYARFSEPFDRMVLDAVSSAPLNTLHLHGDKIYFEPFYKPWPATVINYSVHGTGVSMATVRKNYSGVLMGGIDERNFRKLSHMDLKRMIFPEQAGRKYIVAGGCSLPDDSSDEELLRVTRMLGG